MNARKNYKQEDPSKILYRGKPHEIVKEDSHYTLSFDFPYSAKEDISVLRNADELVVQIGHYRRNISLPRAIVNLNYLT